MSVDEYRKEVAGGYQVTLSGCWIWQGLIHRTGYGLLRRGSDGRRQSAHRASYIVSKGPVPDGLHLDHLCRNRACVNPDHLEPVTRRVNILRGISPIAENARQTHCKRGHEFNAVNTYQWRNSRHCRPCRRTRREEKSQGASR